MEGDARSVRRLDRKSCISIHSLRMEGDLRCFPRYSALFLISIHSLRMEGDRLRNSLRQTVPHFNPLPPHGGRRAPAPVVGAAKYFNPLPPHGGRRMISERMIVIYYVFQSTPSAWRETPLACIMLGALEKFQSTPSAWRETYRSGLYLPCCSFQSTPSAWRETGGGSR